MPQGKQPQRKQPQRKHEPPPRRIGLQVKIVVGLLIISALPLIVSIMLVSAISELASTRIAERTTALRAPLLKAARAYQKLASTTNTLHAQIAKRVAITPDFVQAVRDRDEPAFKRLTDGLFANSRRIRLVSVTDGKQQVLFTRAAPEIPPGKWEIHKHSEPVGDTGATVTLSFAIDKQVKDDFDDISLIVRGYEKVSGEDRPVPEAERWAFLFVVGGVVLVVTLAGILLARRMTKRIETLVSGARDVTRGKLETRVHLQGRDELAELAQAFNRMLDDLEHDRRQIAYLQRMGAWQDVARHLAHEIKNPLTPIQLAVQQICSSYKGEDERFKRLLGDAEEIVTEEIEGLRRLVDNFRTLGQLPKVDAKPLDLATVVEDLSRDPVFMQHLDLAPPDEDVPVHGDRLLLRRVLANLVENGIQAGRKLHEDPRVAVRWRANREDETAELIVEDQGKGVDASNRERIFDPYVTTKSEGTGLGLAISKKITLEHGGSLELDREPSPSGGARFILTLPLSDWSDLSESAGSDGQSDVT